MALLKDGVQFQSVTRWENTVLPCWCSPFAHSTAHGVIYQIKATRIQEQKSSVQHGLDLRAHLIQIYCIQRKKKLE